MDISIDGDYLVRLLGDLVNIPSEFPHEKEVMLFLERELSGLGLPPRRLPIAPDRFNLLARLGEGGPVLCLNAHTDTVPRSPGSRPEARILEGRMYGLGADDDKASVAAMVAAARAVRESGARLAGTLDLLISVDEEGMARGVTGAVDSGYRCDLAITGEPSELEIIPCHCGIVFLELVTHGASTHGSSPWKGSNAIEMMYDLVADLRAAVTDYAPHPMIGGPSMNLGIISGGDRPNRVPDECRASVDIRLVPPMTVRGILERADACFEKWPGRAEYTVARTHGALDTPLESPLVGALSRACERVRGEAPKINGWRGWTEAESFRSGLGVDAVVFGPGALAQAHSSDEYVELEQVHLAAQIYALAALDLLN